MVRQFKNYAFISLLFIVFSCSNKVHETQYVTKSSEIIVKEKPEYMTKQIQDELTPEEVLLLLEQGNNDYVNNELTILNTPERMEQSTQGQNPMAIVLSCIDSRVPVEDIFHKGIGDLFVSRVAGNVVDTDMLASLEYACKKSGSKVIVVMGHDNCGAVKAAIDDVQFGNITSLLDKIKPAIEEAGKDFDGELNSKNHDFVTEVTDENVKTSINAIRDGSPALKKMEEDGDIIIIGAVYDLETGKVNWQKD